MTNAKLPAWPAYTAAAWALGFAAVHAAWAFGWRTGLTAEQARGADSSPLFAGYALAVVAVCCVAVVVALAAARPRPPRRERTARLLSVTLWAGAAILVLRAGGSIVPALQSLIAGRPMAWILPWEPWFWLGAACFTASAWRYRQLRRAARSSEQPRQLSALSSR